MALLELSELELDGYPVIVLSGELTHANAPDLRDLVRKRFKASPLALLLDMAGVSFMDTSGLATLIDARNQANEAGGRVIICGAGARVTDILTVTRVSQLFGVYATTQEAVQALGPQEP